jgi:hypothetical protein
MVGVRAGEVREEDDEGEGETELEGVGVGELTGTGMKRGGDIGERGVGDDRVGQDLGLGA